MKRFGQLWDLITSFENLLLAYRKAKRGKRSRPDVARFSLDLEKHLLQLQADLRAQSYQPGSYRLFTIYERKPRQIAAAPFRDRVLHHALMNVIEPLLDKRFIADSYACRQGKGVHRAVNRYQQWAQRYAYTLKMDIARYFPSIDHAILKQQLANCIKDPQVLWLLNLIIDHSPEFPPAPPVYFAGDDLFTPLQRRIGIPIGNLTSQFFANLYLNGLDHCIKQELRATGYLRYVDDLILMSDDKAQLHAWKQTIMARLETLRLKAHPSKVAIYQSGLGVDVLGYRVFPGFRRLRNDNGFRFARKLRCFAEDYRTGKRDWEDFNSSVQSWIGHAGNADTEGLRRRLFSSIVFTRGRG